MGENIKRYDTAYFLVGIHKKTEYKKNTKLHDLQKFGVLILPAAGLEPARGCPQQILSLPRLPFRHAGISLRNIKYIITEKRELQAFFEKNIKNLQFSFLRYFF